MKVSYQNVRDTYPNEMAERHKVIAPYSYYVFGNLSLRLAPFFINRGMSANQVTALSLLVVIAAQLFAVIGAWWSFSLIISGLVIHFFYLLDNIDGHIARFYGTVSRVGELFDALTTWAHLSLFPLSVGIALYFLHTNRALILGMSIPNWVFPVSGIIRMYSFLFSIAVGRKADAILYECDKPIQSQRRKRLSIAKWIVELEPLVLMVAVVLNCVPEFFLLYVIFWILTFIHSLFYNLKRLSIA